jgi:predicted MFS family arabinose efflux permease
LCLTHDLAIFGALTYLSATFTCIVHIVIPLVSSLSTPERRAFNLSIVGTGPTLGILLARILSGVVAQYTHWRNVYWIGLGVQLTVICVLFLCMPDYKPINSKSARQVLTGYPQTIWSILVLYLKHPVLVQACLLAFISFTTLTAYWTTLTFLLSAEPYNYGTAAIGLFGLIGAATLLLGPLFGRFVITPLRVPLYSAIVGNTLSLVGIVLGTFLGEQTVAGPAIEAVLLDAGLVVVFIANRLSIEGIEPGADNRVNTAFMLIMHLGQLAGTKGGNDVYAQYGGWVPAGLWAIGISIVGYVAVLVRGPNEKRWLGWQGGWRYKVSQAASAEVDEDLGNKCRDFAAQQVNAQQKC